MPLDRKQTGWFLLGLAFEAALGGLAGGLGWFFDVPPWQGIHWQWTALAWGIAATLPMLLAFFAIIRWPVGPLARIKQFADEVIRPLFASCTLFDLALLSFFAGFGEELLFRGFLQQVFSQKFGVMVGVVAAGVLFGLVHLITPTYGVLAALVGIYLGCCWLATGNLLVAIVAHALYDLVALFYIVRLQSSLSEHQSIA